MLGLPAFGFVDPGPSRDRLTARVLAGVKRATSALVVDHVIDREPLPVVGGRSVVLDSAQRPVAIIETTAWDLATIGLVDDGFAHDEGEDFADAAAWRTAHEGYWDSHLAEYRRDLRDPTFALSASTPIVREWFRVVALVDPASHEVTDVLPGGSGA